MDVLGLGVVRIREVGDGSDVAVLLLVSVLGEVMIVPGMQGEKTGSYSQSSRVKENHRL